MSSLRLTFFLLLFANLIFFAWSQGHLGTTDAGREPQRLANQLAPEKLRITAAGEKTATPLCRQVTGLTAEEAEGAKQALARAGITADIGVAEDAPRYWVNIPPQPNRAAADKKAVELRKLGVEDFTIETADGPRRHAVTLGLFRTEPLAREYLLGLGKRGVKSARIDVLDAPPPTTRLTARGTAEVVSRSVADLLAKAPQAKVADCP